MQGGADKRVLVVILMVVSVRMVIIMVVVSIVPIGVW